MSKLKELLETQPEWVAPRSDQHTVIGVKGSRDHRKTFVEPGGSFSPGVGTFGVSVWVFDHVAHRFYAPEEMKESDLFWAWENDYLPMLHSSWQTESGISVHQQLFASALQNAENIVNTQRVEIINEGLPTTDVSIYVTIRPYGAAGGGISRIAGFEERQLLVNGSLVMLAAHKADRFGALSYGQDREEVSVKLREGQMPPRQKAEDDQFKLCTGVFEYRLKLTTGQCQILDFDWFVHPLEHDYKDHFQDYHQQSFEEKHKKVKLEWETLLSPVKLSVPDSAFQAAYYSTLVQFLMATNGSDARIATVTYPLFWIRDGVYIINALDIAGFHSEVGMQLDRLKDRLFAGGFGAEPDAFGETIWPFFTHYKLTNDKSWLAEIYQAMKLRAEWIIKARRTKEYLYEDVEMRVPDQRNSAATDLVCEPARDGLIMGRMDWHRPTIWINAFSLLGLRAVSEMASVLGYHEDAGKYAKEAEELNAALQHYAEDRFGDNERDLVCAIWPTHAFSADSVHVLECFEQWWHQTRLQGIGVYKPESLWKYFEIGQAHNYLFIGDRDKVWQTVGYYLEHHDVRGLYGWLEDNHDISEFWCRIEGWYKLPSRQPHGWVSSELFLLLRDMLLYEQGDTLILGEGIPEHWLEQDAPIQIHQAPTSFGPVDFCVISTDDGECDISVRFHELNRLPEYVDFRLPWNVEAVSTSMGVRMTEHFTIPASSYNKDGIIQFRVDHID